MRILRQRLALTLFSGLILCTYLLSRQIPTTFVLDKPLLSYSVLLLSAAYTVLVCSRVLQKDGAYKARGRHHDALSLDGRGHGGVELHLLNQPSRTEEDDVKRASSTRKLRILSLVLPVAIFLRTHALLQVLLNTQCSVLTWEPLVPFAFACCDCWSVHRHRRLPAQKDETGTVYDGLEQLIVRSQYRYLVTVGLISFASWIAVATTRCQPSTYICAATQYSYWLTPFLQRVGTVLDAIIAYSIAQLLKEPEGSSARSVRSRFQIAGEALLVSFLPVFALGLRITLSSGPHN